MIQQPFNWVTQHGLLYDTESSQHRKWKQKPAIKQYSTTTQILLYVSKETVLYMEKQWKQWQTFFSWAPKSLQMVTCSHEIKRHLLLGRKAMTNLDSILKSRDTTLLTKVHLVKAVVFPGVMYGCESWTIKKAERQRIYAFELWCWRRLLRVPWTARRSNQSVLKEISPEYSLEGLTKDCNPLATWCEELTPGKRPWCWERLKAEGEGDDRGWDDWISSPTQ